MGGSKQGCYSPDVLQYQFNCPFCADEKGGEDGKYNMEVSLSMGKYHCWSCGNAGNLSKLIRKRGGLSMEQQYREIVKSLRESRYYKLGLMEGDVLKEEEFLRLPDGFKKIVIDETEDKQLVSYLEKRRITQDIIDYYNIGVIPWEGKDYKWRNRIVFPSYDSSGGLNYFVGRTYRKNDTRMKYLNCDADKNAIVLHEDKIQWDADICLVEGAIDCIYYANAISMLGKSLNEKTMIYRALMERAHGKVIICLDGDTEENETMRIYKTLNKGALEGMIRFVRMGTAELPWKDFGEAYEAEGREGIIKIMASAKKYSEGDLVFSGI